MISKWSLYFAFISFLFIYCMGYTKYEEYHILERNVKIRSNFIPSYIIFTFFY